MSIVGYRQLNEAEIELMNEGKRLGEAIGAFFEKLEFLPRAWDNQTDGPAIDGRWLAIGKTDMQRGLMCTLRSIARPTTF
jgi:hypothetical protein